MNDHVDSGANAKPLSAQDAALLSEQIAGLTRSGLPLASGLQALGAELPRGRLRRTLGAVARSLEQGASLEEAVAARGGSLPPHLRGLVLAGQRTGRMGEILGRFAGYARIGAEIRRQLWLSLTYPLVSVLLATTLVTFVLLFVVSGFESFFHNFNITMPALSRLLVVLAAGLQQTGRTLAEGSALLCVVAVVVLLLAGPATRRSLLSRTPLLGPVWHWTSLAEFYHLLGLLLESSVPLPEAVPLAGEGVVDSHLRAVVRSMASELARGAPLAGAVARRSFFPSGLGQILAWAEQHQRLAEALHMLGEMSEARARAQANFANTVCTVLTLLVILAGVGVVIFGVFVPLMQAIARLSGIALF